MLVDKNNNYIKDTMPFEKFSNIECMNNDILSFHMKYVQLKNLYRQGWIKVRLGKEFIDRCESVADHSFSMALLGLTIIEKYKLDYDVLKVLKMCILHELGEVYIGDYTPYDNITKEEKKKLEREAQRNLIESLDFENDFFEIMCEYDDRESDMAKFVKNLDELDWLLQAGAYGINVTHCKSAFNNLTDVHCIKIAEDLLKITSEGIVPGGN